VFLLLFLGGIGLAGWLCGLRLYANFSQLVRPVRWVRLPTIASWVCYRRHGGKTDVIWCRLTKIWDISHGV
jgi:hypothetical protein